QPDPGGRRQGQGRQGAGARRRRRHRPHVGGRRRAGARDHAQGRRRHRVRALRPGHLAHLGRGAALGRPAGRLRRLDRVRGGDRPALPLEQAAEPARFPPGQQGGAGRGPARRRGRPHQAGDRPRVPPARRLQGPAADGGPEGAGQARVRAVEPKLGDSPHAGTVPTYDAAMLRLAVIGHIEWVTFAHAPFVPKPGEIVHLTDPLPQPGGGGAVTAVALRRMGAEVTFYTSLGSDGRAREPLERHGLRLEAAQRPDPQTEVLAVVDPQGERTLFVVGENDAARADDPLDWDALAEMDGCYFTGYDPETLRLARRARVLVVTARRFDVLVESGVRVDALVGSGKDR